MVNVGKKPKVSVIVVNYNGIQFIDNCLRSLLNQTYQNYEIIMPFEEHDILISLHTPYQVTKLLGELYTNYFHNLYDLPIVNARFFNVFELGEVPGRYRNVISNFFY